MSRWEALFTCLVFDTFKVRLTTTSTLDPTGRPTGPRLDQYLLLQRYQLMCGPGLGAFEPSEPGPTEPQPGLTLANLTAPVIHELNIDNWQCISAEPRLEPQPSPGRPWLCGRAGLRFFVSPGRAKWALAAAPEPGPSPHITNYEALAGGYHWNNQTD
ncbi:hypothetical protein BDP27DRAFT_1375825 [Rhodocollybia butyracea]|uniref:Uncharacterized protein n=1 Tax=Rhodocollybia butyracea TaxID=206335 RepID=A0A9P5P517_9AGAR|nr:hypothetical protein BDP27DRAFT_1375825 [Rhodocollybia butyracea]